MVQFLFFMLLSLVAFLYASIGHGGATGYIAVMTLFDYTPSEIKNTSLLLNILVAGSAFAFNAPKTGLRISLVFPLLITSIPAAYIGSMLHISHSFFHYLLAAVLLVPAFFLMFPPVQEEEVIQEAPLPHLLLIGLLLGMLSGILGIGGGVFLSPILILKHWSRTRETSTISALFIVLNSIAGLIAVYPNIQLPENVMTIISFVLTGGILGSLLGSKYLPVPLLKKLIALVLIIAIIKLILIF